MDFFIYVLAGIIFVAVSVWLATRTYKKCKAERNGYNTLAMVGVMILIICYNEISLILMLYDVTKPAHEIMQEEILANLWILFKPSFYYCVIIWLVDWLEFSPKSDIYRGKIWDFIFPARK